MKNITSYFVCFKQKQSVIVIQLKSNARLSNVFLDLCFVSCCFSRFSQPLEHLYFCKTKNPACLQVSSGVAAIFGPQNPLLGNHIQSLCDALDIPHIESRVDLEPEVKEISINLFPSPIIIGEALRDVIAYLNWTRIAVIYEDDMCEYHVMILNSF